MFSPHARREQTKWHQAALIISRQHKKNEEICLSPWETSNWNLRLHRNKCVTNHERAHSNYVDICGLFLQTRFSRPVSSVMSHWPPSSQKKGLITNFLDEPNSRTIKGKKFAAGSKNTVREDSFENDFIHGVPNGWNGGFLYTTETLIKHWIMHRKAARVEKKNFIPCSHYFSLCVGSNFNSPS